MGNEAPAGWARRRVLFICIGNSCRSQLAEAFSRHWAADGIEPAVYRRIAAEMEARVLHLAAEFQPEQGHCPTG